MGDSFMTAFIFFAGGLSFLFSLGQFLIRNRRLENLNLSVMFFCIAVILVQLGFIITGKVYSHPDILFFNLTCIYCAGPLLYFAYHLVILPVEKLPRKKFFLLIPTVIAFFIDIYFMTIPENHRVDEFVNLFSGNNTPLVLFIKNAVFIAGVQTVIYLGYLFRKLYSILDSDSMKSELNITIGYTALSIIAYLLLITGLVLSLVTVLKTGAVLISLLIVGSYLIGQRHPKFLQMLYIEAEKKYAKRYLLSDIDTGAILGRMNELMEQERLYSQEDISLKHLAEVLSITPHQLSQLLNELLNTNFNSYVNQYRINEAKHILINEPERSVLSIAYAVGFNSKSSFYEAFSRFTGKTPHTFRKELLM